MLQDTWNLQSGSREPYMVISALFLESGILFGVVLAQARNSTTAQGILDHVKFTVSINRHIWQYCDLRLKKS